MKFKLQTIKDFFKSKEKKGLKPIFFEKIGDKNTSRDEKIYNQKKRFFRIKSTML